MSPKSPKNGKPTLPSVATSLPLLAAFAAIRQNVKLPVPANPLQSSLCPHPSHESFSKSGKNGNVHHPSQHCHNPLPPFPLLSSFPSSLRLLLIPPCSSVSSVVNSLSSSASSAVHLSPPHRFGCGPLPRGVQYSGLRQTRVERAVAALPSPSIPSIGAGRAPAPLKEEPRAVSQPSHDDKSRDLPAGLRLVDGGVTAAPGFRAGNTACGIKSEPGAPDMALLLADRECDVAATFTTSKTASHTVGVCKDHLQRSRHRAQAVIINSGNANCSNGARGLDDAIRMTALAATRLGLDPTKVLVSSTGIIGRPLPMDKIERGIAQIEARPDGGHDFARGIMTTDTRPKTVAVEFEVQGKTVRLGGSTKGVGMIYPNMATMLCYLTTDAAVAPDYLQAVMRRAVDDSFNMVCVDGDMSTNDSAF